MAASLSQHGIAALAVAYFGLPGLPAFHQAVSIDRIHGVIDEFARHPRVARGGVGVFGTSRGGELALLLASTCSTVSRVVANVPSGIVWSGNDASGTTPGSAWSLHGQPVRSLMRSNDSEASRRAWAADVIELAPVFAEAIDRATPEACRDATIPLENACGPVLLLSGGADALWPSKRLAEVAVTRAREEGGTYPVRHICYEDAGHSAVRVPGSPGPVASIHPVYQRLMSTGGSRAANAAATADAWPKLVAFLRNTELG